MAAAEAAAEGKLAEAVAGGGASLSEAERFERAKTNKALFKEGVELFNKKPKKGIQFLQKAGQLAEDPAEVAHFLRVTPSLDKTQIGELLGSPDEADLRVMHAYVDSMEFTGMELDEAIRAFLAGFRLPGEAQKIDRLMEKFAERFCRANPGAFKNADTAYVLSYSVIMLNTDAHNPMVKQKMSKAEFLKNNRGIDDGSEERSSKSCRHLGSSAGGNRFADAASDTPGQQRSEQSEEHRHGERSRMSGDGPAEKVSQQERLGDHRHREDDADDHAGDQCPSSGADRRDQPAVDDAWRGGADIARRRGCGRHVSRR